MKRYVAVLMVMVGIVCYAQEPLLKGWTPMRAGDVDINKCMVSENGKITLKCFLEGLGNFFSTTPTEAVAGNNVVFTFTASVKGKVSCGFHRYPDKGWILAGAMTVKQIEESETPREYKITIPVEGNDVRFIRPLFSLGKDASITISQYSFAVTGEKSKNISVDAKLDQVSAKYKTGEVAVFTLKVIQGEEPVKDGTATVTLLKNNLPQWSKTLDLSKTNPIVLNETSEVPGFVGIQMEVSKEGASKYSSMPLVAAFDPEKIKTGKEAPKDLLSYWNGEYEKLKKEVPPNYKREPAGEAGGFKRYTITADNFDGTKIYAGLTVPNGNGTFPLVLTVPPAGNWGYGFFRFPNAICLTITVFDRLFPTDKDYKEFNSPVWYFKRNATARDKYYYYKAILGVMRMMEYAQTLPEWDKMNIVASGRSQGGGFAFIMAGLNPEIQALSADVPALCDHNATDAGRQPGWPQLLNAEPGFKDNSPYFDAANFAAYVKCPAIVSVGFIDTMCVPSSVYAAFNNLKGEKKIYDCLRTGHGWGDTQATADFEKETDKFLHSRFK